MNNVKLAIKREASKRMMHKNMDLDYIKEITGLSKKLIKNIYQINSSIIGENDYRLRKEYASLHHLYSGYYLSHRTRCYTGADIEKSDFYKNRYMQKGHMDLNDTIGKMERYYANYLRLEAMARMAQHINYSEELISACSIEYPWPDDITSNEDIYIYIRYKIEKFEKKKMILRLLSVEENLKKTAFICNVDDEFVEEVKDNNSIFIKNNLIDLKMLEDEKIKWEEELKYEIARRSTDTYPAVEVNSKILGIEKEELKKFKDQAYTEKEEDYEVRKDIVEKLMQDSHSLQDISEISGIDKFYVNLIVDNQYYNRYFDRYYDKYAGEKLIDFKV